MYKQVIASTPGCAVTARTLHPTRRATVARKMRHKPARGRALRLRTQAFEEGFMGVDVTQMVDPDMVQTSILSGIALSAVGFVGTFFIAPKYKSEFKEEYSWREIYPKLVESGVESLSPSEVEDEIARGATVVDVRPKDEFEEGFIDGSMNFQLYRPIKDWDPVSTIRRAAFAFFAMKGTEQNPDWLSQVESALPKDTRMILCDTRGGSLEQKVGMPFGTESRSLKAAFLLRNAGYTDVLHLRGGVDDWRREGLPLMEYDDDANSGSGDGGAGAGGGGGDGTDSATEAAGLLAKAVANPLFYFVAGAGSIALLSLLGEQVGTIVVLSALPVVGLTAISKSSVGAKVQANLEAQLPELDAAADVQRQEWADAQRSSPLYGEGRQRWLGPAAESLEYQYPAHLDGTLPGDCGFDPLGLAAEAGALERYGEQELLHARWAMLAAVGALIPELLSMSGVDLGEPIWWKVAGEKLNSDITLNYAGIEGFRIAGKQGIWVIAACQLVLMGGPEYARYVGIRSLEPVGIHLPGTPNYPGSQLFDPLSLGSDGATFAEQAVAEVKHGRLAMVAMLGYFAQAAVTRKGPVENLLDFAADPAHNNVLAYLPH